MIAIGEKHKNSNEKRPARIVSLNLQVATLSEEKMLAFLLDAVGNKGEVLISVKADDGDIVQATFIFGCIADK